MGGIGWDDGLVDFASLMSIRLMITLTRNFFYTCCRGAALVLNSVDGLRYVFLLSDIQLW